MTNDTVLTPEIFNQIKDRYKLSEHINPWFSRGTLKVVSEHGNYICKTVGEYIEVVNELKKY